MACQGMGDGMGNGMGQGQGSGDRPEEKNDTKIRNSLVRQNPKGGRAVMTDLVDGRNSKGQVREQIKMELGNAELQDSDPLTDQHLPKAHREHAREYFDAFRGD